MNGWMGKVIRVDLSTGVIKKESISEELRLKYVGGRGLNLKVLYDEIPAGTDPLGDKNKVIIGNGPCSGTMVPGSNRFTLTTKSPLTGFIGDANAGGSFGVRLKYAGYDMVIIEGKAEKPVYLWIDNDEVELRDAKGLWGKNCTQTKRAVESELGDSGVGVISIGPGGENMVRFACVMSDIGRAAGRTGIGAVLGSKNLKAIAARGSNGVKVANPELLQESVRDLYQAWEGKTLLQSFRTVGPTEGLLAYNAAGILPTKNYFYGTYDDIDQVSPRLVAERYFFKPKACFSCPIACDHRFVIDRGRYKGAYGGGFESAQLINFSSLIGVNDLDFVMKAASLCDEHGVDIVEMTATIAYVMECFYNGILTTEDLQGLVPSWGNTDAALKIIDMTVFRQGIGDVFAEGVKKAAELIGKGEDYALHVKGSPICSRDPRGSKAWGLGYAVSSRGADHCRALIVAESGYVTAPGTAGFDPVKGEILGAGAEYQVDSLSEKGKGLMVKWYEDMRGFQNCMELCYFPYLLYSKELGILGTLTKLYKSVTGLELSDKDTLKIGERVVNLERAFNIREGLIRKDDSLPRRFLEEPMPAGPIKGQVVKLDPMLDEYYQCRGWDKVTGFPTRKCLEGLDLKEVADELEKAGKLG